MRSKLKIILLVLLFALGVATTGDAAAGQPIAFTEGNFFVGPQPFPMYVEYFIPIKPTQFEPIPSDQAVNIIDWIARLPSETANGVL